MLIFVYGPLIFFAIIVLGIAVLGITSRPSPLMRQLHIDKKVINKKMLTEGFVPCKAFMGPAYGIELFLDIFNCKLCKIDYSQYTQSDPHSIVKVYYNLAYNDIENINICINNNKHISRVPFSVEIDSAMIFFEKLHLFIDERRFIPLKSIKLCNDENADDTETPFNIELVNIQGYKEHNASILGKMYLESVRLKSFICYSISIRKDISSYTYALFLKSFRSDSRSLNEIKNILVESYTARRVYSIAIAYGMSEVLLENAPCIIQNGLKEYEANELENKLFNVGATVEIIRL